MTIFQKVFITVFGYLCIALALIVGVAWIVSLLLQTIGFWTIVLLLFLGIALIVASLAKSCSEGGPNG